MMVNVKKLPRGQLARATSLMVGALCAGSAWAQVAAQEDPAKGAGTMPVTSIDAPAAQTAVRSPAQDGVLASLADRGVYFNLLYSQEVAGNPSGGIKQGITTSQYLAGGADIDLDKMMGWSGGKLSVSLIGIKSKGLTESYIGGGTSAQENYAPFTFLRFLELLYEQNFSLRNKNDLSFLVGRLGAFNTFARSPFAGLFQNHAHSGALYGFSQSSGTALAPLATWGGRVTWKPTAQTYVHAGSFAIDPAMGDPNTHLWDIGSSHITGQNYMLETGYETDFSTDAMPRHIRLGGWYLDSPRNDVYLNTQGQSYAQFGGTRLTHRHDNGVYVMGDQVISRPNLDSKRNLAVFGSFLYNRGDFEPLQYTAKIGLVKTGTFAERDNDSLGIVVSDLKFSNKEVKFLSESRAKGGGTGTVPKHGYVFEAAYNYALAPGITVAPNLQYLVNPDSRITPSHPRDIPDTLVLGVRLTADLGTLFKLPTAQ